MIRIWWTKVKVTSQNTLLKNWIGNGFANYDKIKEDKMMKCCHFFVQTASYNMKGYPNIVNKPLIGYESASSKGSENYNEG